MWSANEKHDDDDQPDRHAEQPETNSTEHVVLLFLGLPATEDAAEGDVLVAMIAALLGRPVSADGTDQKRRSRKEGSEHRHFASIVSNFQRFGLGGVDRGDNLVDASLCLSFR